MSLAPGVRLGPYEIVSRLGAGGMGEVWRARDARPGRDVAIKVLPAEFAADAERLRRFEQEARATGALNHPHIVSVYDIGTHDGAPYVVTELLVGDTLRARMAAGPLPVRKAVDYAVQIARGLAAAHDKGIVHRDLKPENIFVTAEGHVKILDFGLAKLTRRGGNGRGETATAEIGTEPGVVMGTVGYMSPEQVRGEPVDHRSDLFSFGAVLYEMLGGRRAFSGSTAVETMNAILKDEPPELAIARIPPVLESVLRHCLEKRPEERFRTAHDLSFALGAVTQSSTPSGASAPQQAGRRRAGAVLALLAAAGLLATATAIARLIPRSPPEPPTYRRLTFRRGTVHSARFAPDGQTVVYTAGWNGQPPEVYASRIGNPEWRPLGLQGWVAAVSSTGELAVVLGDRDMLVRVPLAGGAPRDVLDGVLSADFSPDGSQLLVVRQVAGRFRLEYPIGRILYEASARIDEARVSPTGREVAFLELGTAGSHTGAVMVADAAGRKRTLGSVWSEVQRLCWSPDGREVWFSASRGTATVTALYAVSLAGVERPLARGAGTLLLQDVSHDGRGLVVQDESRYEMRGAAPAGTPERDLSWLDWSISADLSPDGNVLLFGESGQAVSSDEGAVYVRRVQESSAIRLGDGTPLALSPDQKWVLAATETPQQLLLLPTGAGQPRFLPRQRMTYSLWGTWHPDGKRISFTGAEPGRGLRRYVQDIDGGPARPVTPEGQLCKFGVFSPDGQVLACDGGLYPIGGGAVMPLAGLGPEDQPAAWSTDGRLLYVFRRSVPAQVFRIEVATGHKQLWKELTPADTAGVSYIYRVHMAPDGGAYVYSYSRHLSDLYLVEGLR